MVKKNLGDNLGLFGFTTCINIHFLVKCVKKSQCAYWVIFM